VFLAGYGAARFVVEFFREADAQFITPDNPDMRLRRGAGRVADGPDPVAADDRPGPVVRAAGTMTPLEVLLIRRIAATGPMRLSDYMAECLLHPEHGYYTRAEPFGATGDFITAPEISQMFGELLGLWLAQLAGSGGAGAFTLAELGPGRGTLMADVLRATRGVPGFHGGSAWCWSRHRPPARGAGGAAGGGGDLGRYGRGPARGAAVPAGQRILRCPAGAAVHPPRAGLGGNHGDGAGGQLALAQGTPLPWRRWRTGWPTRPKARGRTLPRRPRMPGRLRGASRSTAARRWWSIMAAGTAPGRHAAGGARPCLCPRLPPPVRPT
jgi:hypothetical protein